jgi:predicted site-specific integrase-resolvase
MNVLLRKEAAAQLRISLNALTMLVRDGKIKQIHLTKQRRGILQSELDAYITGLAAQ